MAKDGDVLSNCDRCGEPRFVSRSGRMVQRRCKCDWERGFHYRVKRTIHPTFWKEDVKTLGNWSPPIFRGSRAGEFRNLVRIQKAVAMMQLYDFCFRDSSKALYDSIESGKNLFIRGPQGSGRGLLVASVKMNAAIRDIPATPLPGEWSDFRSRLHEAEAYGKDGDLARTVLLDDYVGVSLMTLENIRSERRRTYKGENAPLTSRFAGSIDSIIGRREMKAGAMVLTSSEFAGEIMDTLGDKMQEVLDSPRTSMVLLLAPLEAEELLRAMRTRQDKLAAMLSMSKETEKKKPRKQESMMESYGATQNAALIKESFYFNEAFKNVPLASGSKKKQADATTSELVMISNDYSAEVREICKEFLDEKEHMGLAYRNGVKSARMNVVKSCKELAGKLTERETDIVSRMMSLATDAPDLVNRMVDKAIGLRDEMSGRGEDERR